MTTLRWRPGPVTVPYANLIGGAQEQSGLACRLAAAMLVADAGGVPVLRDATLGYSDPEACLGSVQ